MIATPTSGWPRHAASAACAPLGVVPDPAFARLPPRPAGGRGERRPDDRRRRAAGHPDADQHRASRHPRGRRRAARPAREPRDGEALRGRLIDEAPLVRERACEALAHLGSGDVGQALEDLLADDVRNVRAAAAAALARVGGPGRPPACSRSSTTTAPRSPRSPPPRSQRSRRHHLAGRRGGRRAPEAEARGERAPGRPGVRTAVEIVGLMSVAYAAAIDLSICCSGRSPGVGMKKAIRRRGWAWHQGGVPAAHARRVDRRPGVQRGGGDPRLFGGRSRPALPRLRDRHRRRRLDRRDRRADDRGARPAPGRGRSAEPAPVEPVRELYRGGSPTDITLVRNNGGRADALNAGLDLARTRTCASPTPTRSSTRTG